MELYLAQVLLFHSSRVHLKGNSVNVVTVATQGRPQRPRTPRTVHTASLAGSRKLLCLAQQYRLARSINIRQRILASIHLEVSSATTP